jgi:hypothetical protein
LLLGFGIEPDVACDDALNELCANELADARPGLRRIVGDDREIAFSLPDDLIHQPIGGAHPHEAADHQPSPVGDHGDRVFN